MELKNNSRIGCICLMSLWLLAACDSDNDNNVNTSNTDTGTTNPPVTTPPPAAKEYVYDINVINLTNSQPLSPIGVILHASEKAWMIGEKASTGLEKMAEGGDLSDLLASSWVVDSATGSGILMPGAAETIRVTTHDMAASMLSVATMLVNTNDAFSGVTGLNLADLAVGEKMLLKLPVYDAGTEANSESMGTIPGPADGGEGFNQARDDVDFVSYHPGLVTRDDGLSTSTLTSMHRFDNPVMQISVMRIE